MTRAAPKGRTFLLEIGTEEIPARMVEPALADLAQRLWSDLVSRALTASKAAAAQGNVQVFGTPRRLALKVSGLLESQPDREEEITGPAVRAAYDTDGRPTKAALGFARAQGVPVADLRRLTTPRGECVGVRKAIRGRRAPEVLAEAIPPLVLSMVFPKAMRWGSGEHRFVRPVHSVLALLDEEVIDMTIAGVRAGRDTFGHRFTGKARIPLRHPDQYLDVLRANGVIADIAERRDTIESQLRAQARKAGGQIAPPPGGAEMGEGDPDLLNEVVQLVEWPHVITGTFDRAFLDLPQEVLVTSMRHHQKYFSLLGANGALLDRFLAVANTKEDRAHAIQRGNEWVLRARLADARFFWEDDRKTPLEGRAGSLQRITFQEKLGSYAGKAKRMMRLLGPLLDAFRASGHAVDADAAARAASLCKNDLATQMVKEFPELEGIVGGLYARADGLPAAVAQAIYDHYLPRGLDDPLPSTTEGRIVSLADRFDTQAGIFLLGIIPTGSRDPYALRRAVQGVCRILIEGRVHVSLVRCLGAALDGYAEQAIEGTVARERARGALLEFYRGRLQHLGEAIPLRHDSIRAALAASFDDPLDARLRMEALEAIRREEDFEALVTAHKRIKNILPEAGTPSPARREPRPSAFREEAERRLHGDLAASREAIETLVASRDYRGALARLARLRPSLDRFFESVMVMAEEKDLRENRLALLGAVADLFLHIGDFSEIVQDGEPPAERERVRGETRPGA